MWEFYGIFIHTRNIFLKLELLLGLLFYQSLELLFYQDFLLDQFNTFTLFFRINSDKPISTPNTFWKSVHLKFKSYKPFFMWLDEKIQFLLTLIVLEKVLIWFSFHVFPFKSVYWFTVYFKTAFNFNNLNFLWIILELCCLFFSCMLSYYVQFKSIKKTVRGHLV